MLCRDGVRKAKSQLETGLGKGHKDQEVKLLQVPN